MTRPETSRLTRDVRLAAKRGLAALGAGPLGPAVRRAVRGIQIHVADHRGLDRVGFGGTPDFPPGYMRRIERVAPYTATSDERLGNLFANIEYLTRADIPGAIVECGVWKGGSMMAVALTLLELGHERDLYLFDTYEGMPAPEEGDIDEQGNTFAEGDLAVSVEQVREALASTGYPMHRVHFIKGYVEDTLPAQEPEQIALLRLDTDFHSSTRHELEQLYPRLVVGGVLIIDDYGLFHGARQATDEYFAKSPILLHRLDHSARAAVKLS